jgi:hypothetical protein
MIGNKRAGVELRLKRKPFFCNKEGAYIKIEKGKKEKSIKEMRNWSLNTH